MKILQVVPYFYPAWSYGGPAKLVYDTSREYIRRGHRVTVYTSDAYDADSRMPEQEKISDFDVRYFRNLSNDLAYRANIYLPIGLFFSVPFEIRSYDVIHLHDFYTFANIWITFWARIYRVPYVLSVHGCLETQRMLQRSVFKKIFLDLFGKSILLSAARLIASSENEEQAYRSYGIAKRKIVRLGHGVRRVEFETKKSVAESRRQFTIPRSSVVFTFVGRLHAIKGLDLLIEAFALMREKDAFLIIAGSDDGFLHTVRKMIREHSLSKKTLLLGPTTGETKARLFKATDVFVYPSRSEGFSLGILEAASVGLPLLITDACHFDEVRKSEAGIVVPPTVKSILRGLRRMYGYTDRERTAVGRRAAELIENAYSMQVIGEQLLSIYKKVSY